ncbi:RAC family serine/threonine-protein kinase-like [Durusdinium trenchii]|uniref:RAC family serine/threonine-protein kinase-like n=1 Tax=Durusdinium trenchii TaxID=1381693 RepID=A0ABP0IY27_9DINO
MSRNGSSSRAVDSHSSRVHGSDGIELSVSGTSDSRNSQESMRRWGSLESAILAARSIAQEADELPSRGTAGEPRSPQYSSMRFLIVSVGMVANNVLRAWCICFFAMHRKYYAVIWQLFFELLGFLLSVHNTFRDADVLRKVRQSHCLASCGWALFALIILGLFQVIHVKRAWARQLRSAEVLESLEDQDYMWITPVLGAERGLPVAIVTNIPAVPIMVYAFLLKHCFDMSFWSTQPSTDHSRIWWCEPKTRLETYVLGFSILSQLLVISFSVVDVDIGTSAFLARRYDVSRSMQGKTMMLRLYPFFHILGRISEVMARIAMLCSFLGIAAYKMGLLGAFTTCLVVLLDLAVLLMILQRYSPEDESIYIHFAVACGLLVADGARYVDRPGFCYPARCISRAVDRWHRLQFLLLIALFVVLHVTLLSGERQQEMRFLRCYPLAWSLVISLVVSEGLKCTALKVTGDDLHTAMLNHRISRVRKLLEFSLGGEVLDVNGPTKDSQQVTATMLGAQSGFVEGLRMIMSCGGKVEVRNSQGETCIHLAVRHVQLEALEFLVNQPGAKQVLRTCRAELMKLAAEACGLPVPQGEAAPDVGHLTRESSRLNSEDLRQLFLLLEPDRGTRRNAEVASSVVSLQNVSTHLAMSRHLLRLFPNADEEQAPELHELHSVSALLVAHGCGSLARLLLRRRPQMGLEQLTLGSEQEVFAKKVRTLGQGASGTVIEVECEARPVDRDRDLRDAVPSPVPRSSLRLRLQSDGALMETKRFAMKLQSKRCLVGCPVDRLRDRWNRQAFQTPHYYALLLELCALDAEREM